MKLRKYTPEEIEGIATDYLNGVPIKEISEKYGRSNHAAYYIASKMGLAGKLNRTNRAYSTAEIKDIAKMYTRGVDVSEIARKYNRTTVSIYGIMNRMKIRRYEA